MPNQRVRLKEIQPSAILQVGFGHNDLKVSGFQLARRVFQAADVYDVKGASSSIWASERASCGYGEFATVWSRASNLTGQLRDGYPTLISLGESTPPCGTVLFTTS